jgi:hypothetical protein
MSAEGQNLKRFEKTRPFVIGSMQTVSVGESSLEVGDKIPFFDLQGGVSDCTITGISNGYIQAEVVFPQGVDPLREQVQ